MSRITPGTMTVVLFALLVGLGGAYVVRHHISDQIIVSSPSRSLPVRNEQVIVPVALTDLEPGRVVAIGDIGLVRMSQDDYKKSRYFNTTYMATPDQIAGRTLKSAMKKEAVFSPEDLYPAGSAPGIAERLEAGYRAVSVPLKNVGAVHGFARPGSYVDVMFRSAPAGSRPQVTMTLFERVQVLAINSNVVKDQRVDLNADGTVTLAVTPTQAKLLKVVEGNGEVSLALRREDDEFQFIPFDPALEKSLSQLGIDTSAMRNVSYPTSTTSTASKTSKRGMAADADSIDGVDRVIGNSAERVTMDDLIGFSAEPEKTSMEVYYGRSKEVLTFEASDEPALETLRRGGRIRTPIVDHPLLRKKPIGTAAVGKPSAAGQN